MPLNEEVDKQFINVFREVVEVLERRFKHVEEPSAHVEFDSYSRVSRNPSEQAEHLAPKQTFPLICCTFLDLLSAKALFQTEVLLFILVLEHARVVLRIREKSGHRNPDLSQQRDGNLVLVLNPGYQARLPFLRLALFIRVEVCRPVGRPSVKVIFKLGLLLADQITFN